MVPFEILNWILVGIFWFGVFAYFVLQKEYKFSWKLALGFWFNACFSFFLKYFILIPREVGIGPAFPSFHAQAAFFMAVLAGLKNRRAVIPLLILASLAAWLRVAMGRHSYEDVIAGAIIGAVLAYWLFRREMVKIDIRELARQALHFIGIVFIPIAYYAGNTYAALLAFLSAFVVVAFFRVRCLRRIADFLKRDVEGGYSGALAFLFSIAVVLLLFPWRISSAAIAALCVGDAFSTIFGASFGKIRIGYNKKKTWEGAAAGFFGVYLAMYFFVGREMALIAALIAMIAETIPELNDNVSVPMAVSMVLRVLGA